MLRAYRSIFLVGRQECGESVWWKTVCMEGPQFYEMYFIEADANALVLGHPNRNAHSNENRHYCDTLAGNANRPLVAMFAASETSSSFVIRGILMEQTALIIIELSGNVSWLSIE